MFQLHNKKEIFYNAWGGVGRHFVCLNLWGPIEGRRWNASTRRHREALDVSMMGGLICAVTPPNTCNVQRIRNSWQFFLELFFPIKGIIVNSSQ